MTASGADGPKAAGGSDREARAGFGEFGEFSVEAQRLLAAVQGWATRALPAPPSGHSGPECQWCPLCQLASVLRGEHPELAERIVEAAAAFAGALSALVETAAARSPGAARPGGTRAGGARRSAGSDRPRPRPTPRVQPIQLTPDPPSDSSAPEGPLEDAPEEPPG